MMYAYIAFIIIFTKLVSIQTEPNGVTRTWDEAIVLAKRFAAQLTLEEKCNMTEGVASDCTGFVSPVPRLNFSGFCLQGSQSGVGDSV
ncbi:unnamed protein product, partial [Adineta steineri]